MTTNAWSRRGLAGPNSNRRTPSFRPEAPSFIPGSPGVGDGIEGEYYPLEVAPFMPPDTPHVGHRGLPASSSVCHLTNMSALKCGLLNGF